MPALSSGPRIISNCSFNGMPCADTAHDTQPGRSIQIQWNPSCEATPFAPEKWPFKRGGLSSGVEINTFMFRFTLSSGLSRGGGLLSGWPLKRGSTVQGKLLNAILVCGTPHWKLKLPI